VCICAACRKAYGADRSSWALQQYGCAYCAACSSMQLKHAVRHIYMHSSTKRHTSCLLSLLTRYVICIVCHLCICASLFSRCASCHKPFKEVTQLIRVACSGSSSTTASCCALITARSLLLWHCCCCCCYCQWPRCKSCSSCYVLTELLQPLLLRLCNAAM
jgi:hypothetical protein